MDIQEEFAKYRKACYGDRELTPLQSREVEQAFLSGIHVTCCNKVDYIGSTLFNNIVERLTELQSFPIDRN